MEVRWSALAANDLELIYRRTAKDNPTAAHEVVNAIYDGRSALKEYPALDAQHASKAVEN